MKERIYLSPPHLAGTESEYLADALASNWIAPLGPHVERFQDEFCRITGSAHALAVSSGTAAIHLALLVSGVGRGDEVVTSTFTFIGSVNPIVYVGATPVFVDSERDSWNMDPALLEELLQHRKRSGRLPKAVLVVHLYGQSADTTRIKDICDRFEVLLIEDAAEALGTRDRERQAGTYGRLGAFSFNGNKVITTSGGGMLVSDDGGLFAHALKLATQARDPAPHYQHSEIGYNYRMSNVLAAIGRAQLAVLSDRVDARRRVFSHYSRVLGGTPGITFMPEASWCRHSRWLTTLTIAPEAFGVDAGKVRSALDAANIEARPLWKPMHQQPIFADHEIVNGGVSDALFAQGLCLPSGSALSESQIEHVCAVVLAARR